MISSINQKESLMRAYEIHQEMIDLRRDFHRHPELGFDVQRTASIVARTLSSFGLLVKTNIGKTGVVADLIVPSAYKMIALRADMDALSIQEMNDIPYKSEIPGRAHLCGHDAHTAILLGAAKILTGMKASLETSVRFIFQPSEEVWPGGAGAMIEDGALEGVHEIYAQHVWPELPVGHYGVCRGPAMAQPDGFDIMITGRGGHAATPHSAIDPIVIAAELIQSLQTIVARNVDASESAVLTVTKINAGTTYNAIPDSCSIGGTVRTYSKAIKDLISKRMNEIASGIAKAHGAEILFNYMEGYPATYNDDESAKKVALIAKEIVDPVRVHFPAAKAMFGEDFAYYAQKVKGCFIQLGCQNEEKNITRLLHDPRFNIDEECLVYGAALFVEIVNACKFNMEPAYVS